MEREPVLTNRDLIVRRRGVVCPGLWWDDSLGDDLEVVQVEDVLDGRAGGECNLALLFLLCDLLDGLNNCASVDHAEAGELLIQVPRVF